MLEKIVLILRMIKFSHSVFALPFAIMAAFLAGMQGRPGFPGWGKLTLIIWCMIWARSGAMTFNRIADAHIDARNPRTADRAIPAGKLNLKQAWLFLIVCAVLFIAGTCFFYFPLGPFFGYQNPWPMRLVIPVLLFICLYSYTKRFTWASHFWLGASLMLAPVSTWIAVSPPVGPVISSAVLILGFSVLLWTAGFDIIYSLQDLDVDRREGLYSLPARVGTSAALWISRTCHSFTITLLLILGIRVGLGIIYLLAVIVTAILLAVEHIIVRRGRLSRIKMAFGVINGLISILLAVAAVCDIIY